MYLSKPIECKSLQYTPNSTSSRISIIHCSFTLRMMNTFSEQKIDNTYSWAINNPEAN